MTVFLIALICFLFFCSRERINKSHNLYNNKKATKTNLKLQNKIYDAFYDRYKRKLSYVDTTILDSKYPPSSYNPNQKFLSDIVSNEFIVAGLQPSMTMTEDECDIWLHFHLFPYSNEKPIFDRIMSCEQLSTMFHDLLLSQTRRSMWKKGYSMSYSGKESKWQEFDKTSKKIQQEKINYPWDYN